MKVFNFFILSIFLVSCAEVHSNKTSYSQAQREKWQAKADLGDAESQFQLGKSWCCGKNGFYSTEIAVYWWCKAAEQGHGQANDELTRLGVSRRSKCFIATN